MMRVKHILDNIREPIEVIDMDACDPSSNQEYTTKEQLLLDVENQGMHTKTQEIKQHEVEN